MLYNRNIKDLLVIILKRLHSCYIRMLMLLICEQKMLRVKDEEMSRSGGRGRGLQKKGAGHQTEDEEEDDDDEEEEEGVFSESELELYEQYKAAGYRDLVSMCESLLLTNQLSEQALPVV